MSRTPSTPDSDDWPDWDEVKDLDASGLEKLAEEREASKSSRKERKARKAPWTKRREKKKGLKMSGVRKKPPGPTSGSWHTDSQGQPMWVPDSWDPVVTEELGRDLLRLNPAPVVEAFARSSESSVEFLAETGATESAEEPEKAQPTSKNWQPEKATLAKTVYGDDCWRERERQLCKQPEIRA